MSWKIYESPPGTGTSAVFIDQPTGKFLVLDNVSGATKFELSLYLVLIVVALTLLVIIGSLKKSSRVGPTRL